MASLARECRFQRNAETPSTLNASPIARNSETKIRFYKIHWTVNIAISPNVRYERHIHWWSNMRIFELEERELLEELCSAIAALPGASVHQRAGEERVGARYAPDGLLAVARKSTRLNSRPSCAPRMPPSPSQ